MSFLPNVLLNYYDFYCKVCNACVSLDIDLIYTEHTHTLKSFAIITRWGDIDKIRSNMVIGGHLEFQNY